MHPSARAPNPIRVAMRVGRWTVVGELGRGGNGVVYDVVDGSGVPAALKWWTAGEPDAFEREARLLSDLRHEGVLRAVDRGVAEGRPYVVTERIDGGSLASRLSEQRLRTSGTFDLDEAAADGDAVPLLSIVQRLCGTLAWLHGEGLVHADLKPANVLLRPSGEPVLADLGLTRAVLARAHVEDRVRGSVGYVSPEQARGEPIDARADLYSLGAILFEVLTGAPPLDPSNPRAALQRLQAEDLAPPSTRAEGVDPELDALVGRLLSRDRAARPASALLVAGVLSRLTGEPVAPDRRIRPALFLPPLVGRDGERRAATEAVAGAWRSGGGFVALQGGPGVGTTRLAVEVAAWARTQGAAVWSGRGRPSAAPLAALAPVVARAAAAAGRPDPLAAPEAERAALAARVAALLADAARHRPLLVVLEDLHLASDAASEVVGHVLGALLVRPARVAVLATVGTAGSPSLQALLGAGATVSLAPLSSAAAAEVACGLLGTRELPGALGATLAERAQGSPLLVREWVATAVAHGALRLRPDGWAPATDAGTPATLDALIDARLDLLTPAAAALVSAAAALGDALDEERLERLRPAGDALREGVAARLLERDVDGLRLVHPVVGERALARTPPDARRSLFAAALERFGGEVPAEQRAAWATGAGRPDEAARAWEAAAERDRVVHPTSALAAWRTACALAPDPARAAKAAGLAFEVGTAADLAWVEDALAGPGDATQAAWRHLVSGRRAQLDGRLPAAAEAYARAEEAPALRDFARRSRFAALRASGASAATLRAAFPEHAEPTPVGRFLAASLDFTEGRWADAAAHFLALAEDEAAAERWSAATRALGNASAALFRAGRPAEAWEPAVRCLLLARRHELREAESFRWWTVAQAAELDGAPALATAAASAGLLLAIEQGQRSIAASLAGTLSEVAEGEAAVEAGAAAAAWGGARFAWLVPWALLRRGDRAAAAAALGPEVRPAVHEGMRGDERALAAWMRAAEPEDAALAADVHFLSTGEGRERAIAAWRAVPAIPASTVALARLGVPRTPALPPLPPLLAGALPTTPLPELLALGARRFDRATP